MSSKLAWISPALIGLVTLRLALGAFYALAVPPWESYDEPGHFQYARYIALTGHLLDPEDPEAQRIWSRFQPPLYYVLVAPALLPFDLGEHAFEPELYPYFTSGDVGLNYAVASASTPSDRSQLAALTAMRLAGVVISTISVIFMYLAARRLWPQSPWGALAAASLYAFWPQFVFIGSMATNDLLMTSLAAVLTYCIVRTSQDGLSFRGGVVLALVTAAAILTKLNGLAFVVPTFLTILVGALKQRRQMLFALIGLAALVAVALVLLSGMDFVTDQVFSLETLTRLLSNLSDVSLLGDRLGDVVTYGRRTFVASYGWGNVEAWGLVYPIADVGLAVGLIGAALSRLRRTEAQAPGARSGVLIAASLLLSVVVLAVALAVAQSDRFLVVGRYLLPALPGLILLVCAGWIEILPSKARQQTVLAFVLLEAAISWAVPIGILMPIYALPEPATATDLAAVDTSVGATFAPGMRLLGAKLAESDGPEQPLNVTLCWQADRAIDRNYPLMLTLIGPDGQGYGHSVRYPGQGNYPTALWTPTVPFCETYRLEVRGDYPAPAVGAVEVSFLTRPKDESEVPAATPDGVGLPTSPRVPAVVHGYSETDTAPLGQAVNLHFGDAIALETIALEPHADRQGLDVVLTWRCLAPVPADVEVFAHLRSSPTELFAQDDSRPRQDWYPTPYWRTGEVIVDRRTFSYDLANAPELAFYVGMYTNTGRLLAVTASGDRLQNDEFVFPLNLGP